MGVREGPKTRGRAKPEDIDIILGKGPALGNYEHHRTMNKTCETEKPQIRICLNAKPEQSNPKEWRPPRPSGQHSDTINANCLSKVIFGLSVVFGSLFHSDLSGATANGFSQGTNLGLFYWLTHMSPYVYFILFIIFVASVINLCRQGYLPDVSGNEYVRPKEFKDSEDIPRNVIDGKIEDISKKVAQEGKGAKERSKNLAVNLGRENSLNEPYTKRIEIPRLKEEPHNIQKYQISKRASSKSSNIRARVNQRVRLDKARLVFGRPGFASAYTREDTLESAENWAASLALMSGRLFGKSLSSLDQVSKGSSSFDGSSFTGINTMDIKGGIIMPPKKNTTTKRATKKKVEKVDPVMETNAENNTESAIVSAPGPKGELTARMSRIDSLIEAAEQGDFSGRVPEIRKEHETRWGKLLEEDISLREQILSLKQKENTLLKMIRDKVADNVLETADVAGQNGLIKTPKA